MAEPERLEDIFKRLGIDPTQLVDRTPEEQREHTDAARSAMWAKACEAGRCRYADADPREENPPSVDSTITCGGYFGVRRMETMHAGDTPQPVWRWNKCERHREWARRRYAHVQTLRERTKGKS